MIKWIYPSTLTTQKMGKIYEISISGHWITGRVWEKQKKKTNTKMVIIIRNISVVLLKLVVSEQNIHHVNINF